MTMALLGLLTLVIGFVSGATSVGGVLLVPALDACLDLGLRTVMGTVLFSFFFTGLVGTYMHGSRIDWRAAVPLCLGCLAAGYPGAVAKEHLSLPVLNVILAAAIVVAGATVLRPVAAPIRNKSAAAASPKTGSAALFLIGAAVSFLSALTGAGGPVLSVPVMLLLGYGPLTAIAVSLPLQVAVTFSGSIGNIAVGSVDYRAAALITALLGTGVAAGAYSVRYFKPDTLRKAVALMCVGTGAFMLLNNLFG